MADGAVNWFLDAIDDPLLPDAVPSFEGGQFSNLRANLLKENQSKQLVNTDIDRLGKIRTRRGTLLLGTGPPSGVAAKIVQGLTSYQTPDANYIVAAQNKKIYKYTDGTPGTWTQIALGGTVDNEDILICREGLIDQSTVSTSLPNGGYAMGTTAIVVNGLPAMAAPLLAAGEKLYFVNNRRTDPFEYIIANWSAGGAGAGTITLEEPGLVFDVADNWKFIVTRPAKVNGDFAAGLTTIAIDGYSGEVFDTEKFVIRSENITHTISSHTPGGAGTTGLTFTPGLIADYAAATDDNPVVFAQGNDSLYFCDGTGPIFSWNGQTLGKVGSHSILDDLQGSAYSRAVTAPPTGASVLLWFQNRLIASGVGTEPDAIFFSDFFDPTSWDRIYQMVRIGGGESDPITGLLAWTDYNMIVFKKNSCYLINLDPAQNQNPNDPTGLVASFSVKQLHKLIGCPAPRTAGQVGGGSTTPGSDVFFVDGDKKVHSIRRVMAAETQSEVGQAVSLPMQDILDTIDIDHIGNCVAMYHNEHYILGFPSTRGIGGIWPDRTVAYNLLTQSWCGEWTWSPTCFSRRTDLGSYSKLIFGENLYNSTTGAVTFGQVVQWMDDISLDEEVTSSYQDRVPAVGDGNDIGTQILTRAFIGGDFYSYKTGLSVEFEFDESTALEVTVKPVLDKVVKGSLTEQPFSSLSTTPLHLPFVLPAILSDTPGLVRKAFDLQRYGTWRELQFQISTPKDKLALRSIRITFFMDTLRLQTVPVAGESATTATTVAMMMPTTLEQDAEKYAKFVVDNVPQAKAWEDPVGQAAWYIGHGFACAVHDADTNEIVSMVTARPVERPGIGTIPYYFNEGGTCLHVDLLLDISPDERSLMVIKLFLQMRFPQCTTITCFRHFEEKMHVYRLPEFWRSFEKIKRVKRGKKHRQRDDKNYLKKVSVPK